MSLTESSRVCLIVVIAILAMVSICYFRCQSSPAPPSPTGSNDVTPPKVDSNQEHPTISAEQHLERPQVGPTPDPIPVVTGSHIGARQFD